MMQDAGIISEESSDADLKSMRDQLADFGLDDESLSKEEMIDLLKALNNSKSTVKEDEVLRQKVVETPAILPTKTLKRKYLDVQDRRLPWSVMPRSLTPSEKARVLAVYIKIMSINRYKQARLSANFESWPPPIQIHEESTMRSHSLRSTRSGRSVPVYADLDDDSSDIDFAITKPKKRKISGAETNEGVYTNKVVSLKRKNTKDENHKANKEMKIDNNLDVKPGTSKKPSIEIVTIFED